MFALFYRSSGLMSLLLLALTVFSLAVAVGQIVSTNFGPLLSACRLQTPLEAVQR